jgi:hypothetical protein
MPTVREADGMRKLLIVRAQARMLANILHRHRSDCGCADQNRASRSGRSPPRRLTVQPAKVTPLAAGLPAEALGAKAGKAVGSRKNRGLGV